MKLLIASITFADPNTALVAAAIGVLLIAVEFCFPGAVIPASVGGALLLIGLWHLSQQPLRARAAAGALLALTILAAAGWFAPAAWRWAGLAAGAALLGGSLWRLAADIQWQIAAVIATILSPILVRLLSLAAVAHRHKMDIATP